MSPWVLRLIHQNMCYSCESCSCIMSSKAGLQLCRYREQFGRILSVFDSWLLVWSCGGFVLNSNHCSVVLCSGSVYHMALWGFQMPNTFRERTDYNKLIYLTDFQRSHAIFSTHVFCTVICRVNFMRAWWHQANSQVSFLLWLHFT